MALFGELFLNEIIRLPVFDPKGEVIGRVKDVLVVKGEPLPKLSGLIIERKGAFFLVKWAAVNIFNKRIISSFLYAEGLESYSFPEEDLLAVRDILDKQIVDANGVQVVNVRDIKLEGYQGDAVLLACDISWQGYFRRVRLERFGEKLLELLHAKHVYDLISWNYIQPLEPKLKAVALTVPRQMVSELHPADLAEIISQVPPEEGADLLKDLDVETAAEALSEMEPDVQADIIEEIDVKDMADIIEEMQPDDAADVLSDLPIEKAKEILEHIEHEESQDIQELLVHREGTAGGVMTTEYVQFSQDMTVRDAITNFRKEAEEVGTVYYIYAVDAGGKLAGVISLRELLLADPDARLSEIMETKLVKAGQSEDVEEVTELIKKYNLVALPVVDENGQLVGIVTIDDIMDVVEEEATEDIYRLAGTSELPYGNIEEARALDIFKSRVPWLMLCLCGGLVSSFVVSYFEHTLTTVVVLAAFIPVIMGMAGNAGLQVSTTMVRNIALNSIKNYWKYVAKELMTGFMIAATTGIAIAVAAGLLKGMPVIGFIVGISMFLAISSSTVLAIVTPTVADRVGIDPAITAGPFVTVFNDILGLTIYFTVASIFMKLLL